MAEMADDDDTESELRRSIEQNCRVLSRPPVALEVLQTLADTYLAQPPHLD